MIVERRHHLEEKRREGTTQLLTPSLDNISSYATTDNEKEEISIYPQAHHGPKLFTGYEIFSKLKAQLYQNQRV